VAWTRECLPTNIPNEVVGMVLVDSSHPDQDDRFSAGGQKLAASFLLRNSRNAIHSAHRLAAISGVSVGSPPEVRPEFCAVFCRRQYLAAVRAEAAAQQENSAQVRALTSLGNLPLVVLSHDPDKVRFPGKLTEPVNREWGEMQEELAHLSSNGSHLVVKGSGHDIQIDNPEAVVDAIRKVVGQAKGLADSSGRQFQTMQVD